MCTEPSTKSRCSRKFWAQDPGKLLCYHYNNGKCSSTCCCTIRVDPLCKKKCQNRVRTYEPFNSEQNPSNCFHLLISGWEDSRLWNMRSFQTSTEHKYLVKVPKKYLLSVILSHIFVQGYHITERHFKCFCEQGFLLVLISLLFFKSSHRIKVKTPSHLNCLMWQKMTGEVYMYLQITIWRK